MDQKLSRLTRKPTLGLIGYGLFGRLVAGTLRKRFHVVVHDAERSAQVLAKAEGLEPVCIGAAASCDIVVLAVPAGALDEVLRSIASRLKPGALVIDVTSIKGEPARTMDQLLPQHARIVATHPMFGPNSASAERASLTVVVCPVRDRAWRAVAAFLRRLSFRVVVVSPDEHDRQAALTQGLTHLLARALASFDPSLEIRTRSYDLLMSALAMVKDDSPEVYEAITRHNPHVAHVRDDLIRALSW